MTSIIRSGPIIRRGSAFEQQRRDRPVDAQKHQQHEEMVRGKHSNSPHRIHSHQFNHKSSLAQPSLHLQTGLMGSHRPPLPHAQSRHDFRLIAAGQGLQNQSHQHQLPARRSRSPRYSLDHVRNQTEIIQSHWFQLPPIIVSQTKERQHRYLHQSFAQRCHSNQVSLRINAKRSRSFVRVRLG